METLPWMGLDGLFGAPYKSHQGGVNDNNNNNNNTGNSFGSKENMNKWILGLEIMWVQVSRFPMPHLDKDRWTCTMFH